MASDIKLDKEVLKYLAVNSSPFTAAVALAVLDEITDGKVTEFIENYVMKSKKV